jgi:glycosyltransferase involved in cell wall biosynthesis
VMVEAMALGCPVISFERGAAPEIVVPGETGFLVYNVAEMVECIPHIDDIDREALHGYVEQHFSARIMAEEYVKVYEKVIELKRVRATKKAAGRRGSSLK